MFKAILFTQWKWTRWPLLIGVLLTFTIPVLSVQRAGLGFGARYDRFSTAATLSTVEAWSVAYPILAVLIAMFAAAMAWGMDEKGKHVYALSLPIPRWHYLVLRLGAGALLLIAPVVALLIGGGLAVAGATIPPGTEAHVVALTVRFALSLLVAYTLVFALASGGERMGYAIGGALAVLALAHVTFAMFGLGDVLQFVAEKLLLWPGPLQIFIGRWMLIDV